MEIEYKLHHISNTTQFELPALAFNTVQNGVRLTLWVYSIYEQWKYILPDMHNIYVVW